MSNKTWLIAVILIGLASTGLAIVDPDGLYRPTAGYYVASRSEVVDLTPKSEVKATQVAKAEEPSKPIPLTEALADVTTNFNIDVNTSQAENKDVDQAQIAANLSVNKGPFFVQYNHSRSYTKSVDPYTAQASNQFQGMVTNRVTFGVNLTPNLVSPSNVAETKPAETTAAVPTIKASAIN